MIQLPILGAFIEAVGTTIEKNLFKRTKISSSVYTTLSFLSIVLLMIPFIYFFWSIKTGALSFTNLFLLVIVVVFATAANLFTYYALKGEKIIEFEPIWLTQPVFTIILAFMLYGAGGKIYVFIFSLAASLALIAAHIRKQHINFDKYAVALLLGNVFYAVELVASEPLLKFISPFTLYFIRCTFVLVILLAMYRPKAKGLGYKNWLIILFVAALWVVYRVILYYGYISYGIIFTTNLFILAPVFLLILDKIFLKENMTKRQIIATVIILICVSAAVYLNG